MSDQTEKPIRHLLRELHHRIEAKEHQRISQPAMARRVGIHYRTYTDYLRGTNAPLGMRVLIDLLCMLDNDEALAVVEHWREYRKTSTITKTIESKIA